MTPGERTLRDLYEHYTAVRAGTAQRVEGRNYDGPPSTHEDDSGFEHPEGIQWSPEQWETHEQRARESAGNWRRR